MGAGSSASNQSRRKTSEANVTNGFLAKSPIAVLMDSRTLGEFAECFEMIKLKEKADIDPSMIGSSGEFFIVGDGQIDVSVKLPSDNKKTEYVSNVLCTKKAGDVLHVPAVEAVAKDLAAGTPGSPKRRLSITSLLQRNNPPVSSPKTVERTAEIPEPPPGFYDQPKDAPGTDAEGNPRPRARSRSMTSSYIDARIESGSFTYMRNEDIKTNMSPNSEMARQILEASSAAVAESEAEAKEKEKGKARGRKGSIKSSADKILRQMDLTTISAPYGATLLHLDKDKFRAFEQARAHGGAADVVGTFIDFELLRAMLTSNIQDYLKKIPFLAKVPTSRLHMLGEMTQFEVFNPQVQVCGEGEVGDKIYVVMLGNLTVTAQGPIDEVTKTRPIAHLADLEMGDYFGELAVLADIPRQATVKTASKCLLISIERAPFRSLMKVIPDFGHTVQSLMKLYMISKFITGAFDPMSIKTMNVEKLQHDLFKTCSIVEVPADQVLIEEGGPADSVYFIYHGHVRASKRAYPGSPKAAANAEGFDVPEGDRHVGLLNPGQYFGEISILTNSPCRATLTTTTRCMLLRIRQEEFLRSWCKVQGFRAQFLVRILGSNSRLEHVLEHNLSRAHFEEFVDKEHAGENLRFYWSAYDFKAGHDKRTSEENYEMANSLFVKYCSHDADEQVNLPEHMVKSVREKIDKYYTENASPGADETTGSSERKQRHPSADTFDEARIEIFELLEKGAFYRFKFSPAFVAMLGSLPAYNPLDVSDVNSEEMAIRPAGKFLNPKLTRQRSRPSLDYLPSGAPMVNGQSD